jgi:hypothetical protein
MGTLPKDVLNQIIIDAKEDVDNPLRQGPVSYSGWEPEPMPEPHVCDENCNHKTIPPAVAHVLINRAKRLQNAAKRGKKKKH